MNAYLRVQFSKRAFLSPKHTKFYYCSIEDKTLVIRENPNAPIERTINLDDVLSLEQHKNSIKIQPTGISLEYLRIYFPEHQSTSEWLNLLRPRIPKKKDKNRDKIDLTYSHSPLMPSSYFDSAGKEPLRSFSEATSVRQITETFEKISAKNLGTLTSKKSKRFSSLSSASNQDTRCRSESEKSSPNSSLIRTSRRSNEKYKVEDLNSQASSKQPVKQEHSILPLSTPNQSRNSTQSRSISFFKRFGRSTSKRLESASASINKNDQLKQNNENNISTHRSSPKAPSTTSGALTKQYIQNKMKVDPVPRVVAEIVDTEKAYGQYLSSLLSCYVEPLRKAAGSRTSGGSSFPTLEQVNAFTPSCLPSLIMLNEHFLGALERDVANDPARVGSVFLHYGSFFKMYKEYASGFDEAVQTFRQACRDFPSMTSFLEECVKNSGIRLGFEDLLIMPIQRIPRYGLMLNEILKHKSVSDPHRKDMERALALINDINRLIDSSIHQLALIRGFQSLISSQHYKQILRLVGPTRKLVADMVIRASSKPLGTPNRHRLVVFNDLMVWVKDIRTVTRASPAPESNQNLNVWPLRLVWVALKDTTATVIGPYGRRLICVLEGDAVGLFKHLEYQVQNCVAKTTSPLMNRAGGSHHSGSGSASNFESRSLPFDSFKYLKGVRSPTKLNTWRLYQLSSLPGLSNTDHDSKQTITKSNFSLFNKGGYTAKRKHPSENRDLEMTNNSSNALSDALLSQRSMVGLSCFLNPKQLSLIQREGAFMSYRSHALYHGQWVLGLPQGYGTLFYADGIYMGSWMNGQRSGKGIQQISSGGTIYEGEWAQDLHQGDGHLYRMVTNDVKPSANSNWKSEPLSAQCPSPPPSSTRKSISLNSVARIRKGNKQAPPSYNLVYRGQWSAGMFHGEGTHYQLFGGIYDGKWERGTHLGFGAWLSSTRTTFYFGSWGNDQYEGSGVLLRFTSPVSEDIIQSLKNIGISSKMPTAPALASEFDAMFSSIMIVIRSIAFYSLYVGCFNQGREIGLAQFFRPEIGHYIGNLAEDSHFSGVGTFRYDSKDVYEGEWKNGLYHGKGYYTWTKSGITYTGEWFQGLRQGSGKLCTKDGHLIYGNKWQGDCFHGLGTYSNYSDLNPSWYRGEWFKGKREGRGIAQLASGTNYDGTWQNGKIHGKGKISTLSGVCYQGNFQNGKMQGSGKFTFANGTVVIGKWQHGKIDPKNISSISLGSQLPFTIEEYSQVLSELEYRLEDNLEDMAKCCKADTLTNAAPTDMNAKWLIEAIAREIDNSFIGVDMEFDYIIGDIPIPWARTGVLTSVHGPC